MHDDFLDMLSAEGARCLIVGAYALAHHGLPRATGDIDIWVDRSPHNAALIWKALGRFGVPLDDLSETDFLEPDLVLQIGVAPSRIDLLTSIDGVDFATAWEGRAEASVEDVTFGVLSRDHLIANKRAVGRPQDLADLSWLESDASE